MFDMHFQTLMQYPSQLSGPCCLQEIALLDKQAKKAKLAIRRFLRRRTKESNEALSLSLVETNAQIFSDVGAELMGVNQIDSSNTVDGSNRRSSSNSEFERLKMHTGVLCFDEININDPFTALALKGELCCSFFKLVTRV